MEDGHGQPGDLDELAFQAKMWNPGNTFCALAPGIADLLQTALKYFRADFAGTSASTAVPGDRYGDDLRRRQTVPDEPGRESAPRLALAGIQGAVLLLVSGSPSCSSLMSQCRERVNAAGLLCGN